MESQVVVEVLIKNQLFFCWSLFHFCPIVFPEVGSLKIKNVL